MMSLINVTISRFDGSFITILQTTLFENLSQLLILWSMAPGASCHSLGTRIGITFKKLLKITIEAVSLQEGVPIEAV
jgi:hypothetical protein